ncbi:glycosyltransferase family 2 protein [Amycolatopsis suaedae]|uniref:glycosyltransferase family 2 protein n=1 Tax=Amycolatopsis suaedae TaxID=2510978 RepID=UPI001F0F0B0E|nr:glycosyltransferase family 2 protein [Amycolatopsis suaedae]
MLAVLVCHNGDAWLPLALSALRRSTVRPRHVVAVDTGSADRTPHLLTEAADPAAAAGASGPAIDAIVTLSSETGFAEAVAAAVEYATERWGDPGEWLWLLHDDCAPEPDCLDTLLKAAEPSPLAGVLGPIALDWADPRLVVEAGLSTDASGHRQSVAGGLEERPGQSTEVLAVPSAGALVSRRLWEELDGFDTELPLLREDIDFGWRANAAGRVVLSVPAARVRHVRAVSTGRREATALPVGVAAADRALGLRTFLVNCSALSFWIGVPRLVLLCVLRGLGFALVRRGARARGEFAAVGYLLSGRAALRQARARRAAERDGGAARGLLTSRLTRLRNATKTAVLALVTKRLASEAALGRLPEPDPESSQTAWIPPESLDSGERPRPVGPDALPAGVRRTTRVRAPGLRRPGGSRSAGVVAVPVPAPEPEPAEEKPRPSPGPRTSERELVFVQVDRRRVLAATVLAPPVVLVVALTVLGLLVNGHRLGLELSGGRLLPAGDLAEVWSAYLRSWHPVGGGTAAAASPALALLGMFGAVLGGPSVLVAVLLLGQLPLSALTAYLATRKLRVGRWPRAAVAAAYAMLPAATGAVAQGRLDVVVVHLVLPLVLAGVAGVLAGSGRRWLHGAVHCAIGCAVLGAFSPLALGLVLLVLLTGFVVLPSDGPLRRRAAAVVTVVLASLLLLLPWLPTLIGHPALMLHGMGGPGVAPVAGELLGLDPGGDGTLPVGLAVVVAALVAAVLRPGKWLLPGLGVAAVGGAAAVAVGTVALPPPAGGPAAAAHAGVPLVLAGAGLLWVVLAAVSRTATGLRMPKVAVVAGGLTVAVLAAGVVLAGGEGPVRAGHGTELTASLPADVAGSGRSVFVLGDPPRLTAGRLPHWGDDGLPLVDGAAARLADWQTRLLVAERHATQDALLGMAANGVLLVVLPPGVDGSAQLAAGGDLVTPAAPTADGRAVLRLTPAAGQVVLISPELAHRSVNGRLPEVQSPDASVAGTALVDARLPDVRVRVSDGPDGRLLVLAAELEPGWRATVDGRPVSLVPAWGHQVAVAVPTRQAEVVVEYPDTAHGLLLLGQVAALLFCLLTAVPSRAIREAGDRTRKST